ncbi:ABC transporter ATP-binding protein [Mangrovactinospora gilvigrisea]|uniref:ABC transporter ATP-binding protein n=1 Tax=Mangrovactinospora gilvigrisea TaxID=1428644 RepID=A0A1J7C147_9ACTN|nr:ABC transporter ATP-binding protein [Mangrovactinospora gilvigrisea]
MLWSRALVRHRGGGPVLRGVSAGVREGELLAVTGTRGAGKTTLLECWSGTTAADSGEVWFNSAPVHTLSAGRRERLRREHFGFVGPEPRLLAELTAAENAAVGGMLRGLRRRAAEAAAAEWLDRLELGELARLRPDGLPREAQQRVAVARALTGAPSVVFADDPTACLDTAGSARLLRVLATAVRSHRMTLVLATADPEVAALADRRLHLTDGRLTPDPGWGAGEKRRQAGYRADGDGR